MGELKAPKGTRDVLPEQSYRWQYLESTMRDIVKKYGFLEARTPVFEHTEVFLRGVGGTTDIVQKEMYTFQDKGDRSITLKPEGTAGVVRMFVESGLCGDTQPTKIFYVNNPVFRYERPQAGRLREHHQFGVEFFGAPSPSADAECIAVACEVLRAVGCTDLSVRLNSIGCPECRPKFHAALKEYLASRCDELCETCKGRYKTNPLRILDCKEPHCTEINAGAPSVLDYLCDECRDHLEKLKQYLSILGLSYEMTPTLVRGLDYYTKTVFEIVSNRIGAQSAVCGGGRYDGLVTELGGLKTPGVGFGMGMERLLLLLENAGIEIDKPRHYDLYIASMGDAAGYRAFELATRLREKGVRVEIDHVGRSFKAQFKYADKIGAAYVLALGDNEIAAGKAKLKSMADGSEQETELTADAVNALIKR